MSHPSRRDALAWALGCAAFGCRSAKRGAPSPAQSALATPSETPNRVGDLAVLQVTDMQPTERGGHAVVLLHGYGAPGDDLVPLANALLRPRTRFLLPAAPLTVGDSGRAWWGLTPERPRIETDTSADSQPLSTPALDAARSAVQRVLAHTLTQFAPDTLSRGGFSQGAMLSLDVALVAPPAVARLALLSGALLADAAARLDHGFVDRKPAVFLAHGREDRVLPFSGAERMRAELTARKFDVAWRPFSGGHEIPNEVARDLTSFLFGS